jgi:Rrf2 family protein
MKMSTKGRYGLRVMLELALRHGSGPIMMSVIAQSQDISRKYIHSLLTSLKAAGLVRSVRGAGGGYVLATEPSKILLSDVVQALEGAFFPVDCVGDSTLCDRSDFCVTREVWSELGIAIEKVLSKMTLEQLASKQRAKLTERLMFHI